VAKVLVSNNRELLRHFSAAPFQRLGLDVIVADSDAEARKLFAEHEPALVLLDAEQQGGFAVAKAIKQQSPSTRVVLVAGRRLSGEQMREVAACGADELLIAPMTADELHDVIAIQLGEPRPGTEAFAVTVEVDGKTVDAQLSNLSVDGVRMVVAMPLAEGQRVALTLTPGDGDGPVALKGAVLWAQPRDGKTVVGLGFDALDARAKAVIAKLTQWQVVKDGERTRVVLRGDFTEATRFDELVPAMVGRVVFDTAQVTYMNSLGVRAWCEFLRQARIQGYEFHACSVPFILQASMVKDVIGRGTVTSFFAPFHCINCDHQEERLLQSAAILAANLEPPVFKCPSCGGALEFDDLPERYFAFLQDDAD